MVIPHLPDLCVLPILGYIPLQQLLHINVASRRFAKLQSEALSNRRSVTILADLQKSDPTYLITETCFTPACPTVPIAPDGSLLVATSIVGTEADLNTLRFTSFSEERARRLCESLPNITSLVFANEFAYHGSSIPGLLLLLETYSSTLVSLKLYSHMGMSNSYYQQLFVSINNLKALKCLTLEVDHFDHNQSLDLPILSQLEHFHFKSYDRPSVLLDSLNRYAVHNKSLKSIGVMSEQREDECAAFLQIHPDLVRKFTHLHLSRRISLNNVSALLAHFNQLTTLYIDPRDEHPFTIIPFLVSLPALVDLRFPVFGRYSKSIPQLPPERVPSVKFLTLRLCTTSHFQLADFQLETLFPSVRLIKLMRDWDFYTCVVCHYNPIRKDKEKRCYSSMCAPLREAPLVRRIIVQSYGRIEYEWTSWDGEL